MARTKKHKCLGCEGQGVVFGPDGRGMKRMHRCTKCSGQGSVDTKPLTRKPVEGSVAFYRDEWRRVLLTAGVTSEPLVREMAQQSYENRVLRERLKKLETAMASIATGMILDGDSNPHLVSCAVHMEGPCTCGSVPEKSTHEDPLN